MALHPDFIRLPISGSRVASPTPAPVKAVTTARTLQNRRLRPASQRALNTGYWR